MSGVELHHITGTYQKEGTAVKKINDTVSTTTPAIDEASLAAIMPHVEQNRQLLREENLKLTRLAVRNSVSRDLLIINTINTIEELDKVTNTLSKRLREWYALYDPETEHRLREHKLLVEEILANKPRSHNTMGGTLTEEDLMILHAEAARVRDLYEQRDRLLDYLEAIMQEYTPNVKKVAGAMIGAKLIALAGSLSRLSSMPSGTVQLLGAETALFRHLRNPRARPPKHGIIFNHLLLQRAPKNLRGKAARTLADKISIGAKVDFFRGEYVGDALYAEVEKKINGDKKNDKASRENSRDNNNDNEVRA
jgi:nucleolar protein 56